MVPSSGTRRGEAGLKLPLNAKLPLVQRWPSRCTSSSSAPGKWAGTWRGGLLEKGGEVTLIENNRGRYLTVEQELEHNIQAGDASELWVLEQAGISRADMVIAVTGDDEDNILIYQVAKEKYLVDRIIARVNNPRNREHFGLLQDQARGLGDRPHPAPDRARGARVRPGAPPGSA